jgi:3D-(3,5/4)-trihydroxycyclohexane-1,2-dione acylhydrolase (decyclizing)
VSKTAFQHPDVRFVTINIADFDAHKHAALPLVADARSGLEALTNTGFQVALDYQQEVERLRSAWHAEVDRVRERTTASGLMSQAEVIGVVNDAARAEDVVVCAAGSLPGDLHKLWRAASPGSYHLEYGYSCMGYEIAGGLGAKLARPETDVFVMVGDGSYLMLSNELATSVQEGLKLIVVLLDNHGFGCIHGLAGSCGAHDTFNQFRFREASTGLLTGDTLPIDFAANAASLGARVACPRSREALAQALEEAQATDRTTVIVVEIDPDASVPAYDAWWDVPVAAISTSEDVQHARARYEIDRQQERWFV